MAQQQLRTQRELMLPNVNDINEADFETLREFLKKMLKVIEDTHVDIQTDLEAINSQV